MNRHFLYEENILFPLLGKYIGTTVGPIAVMLSEHRIIRERHGIFREKLNGWKNGSIDEAQLTKSFQSLEVMLSAHIHKEDHVLFPMASNVMSEEDKNEVARKVESEKERN